MPPARKPVPARAASASGAGSPVPATPARTSAASRAIAPSTSDAKRLKKRETDRRCQREARQRTKTRIAYLESLVEELRRKDTSGQVASLMTQLGETRKERDTFARTLRGIEESIKGCWIGGGESSQPLAGEPASGDLAAAAPAALDTYPPASSSDAVMTLATSSTPTSRAQDFTHLGGSLDMFNAGHMDDGTEVVSPQHDPMYPLDLNGVNIDPSMQQSSFGSDSDPVLSPHGTPALVHCDRCDPVQVDQSSYGNVWAFAHAVIGPGPTLLAPEILAWEDQVSADLPIRIMVDGWEVTARLLGGKLPPLWAKLRQIDETVFGELDKVERLAILSVMHLLLRFHSGPGHVAREQMPAWYLARPSQDMTHSYALDFFTWPGIRERFVFRPHQYCTNTFWRSHNKHLRILWPSDISTCYTRNSTTGAFSILPEFEKRILDIRAWTMHSDFFQSYPELKSDIAAFGTIRRSLIPPHNQQQPNRRLRSMFRRSPGVVTEAEEDVSLILRGVTPPATENPRLR